MENKSVSNEKIEDYLVRTRSTKIRKVPTRYND
jgi:hypothetical protein